jgi:hypothetical protein
VTLSEATEMSWLELLLRPNVLPFLIPIVAIAMGGAIAIVKMVIVHRERIAKIEHGLNQDAPPTE